MATKTKQTALKEPFKKVFDSRNRRARHPETVPQAVAALQDLLAKRRLGG